MRMNEAAGRQDDSGEQVRAYLQWFLQENVAQLQAIICGYVGSQSKSVQDPSHSEPLIEHWDGRRWRVDNRSTCRLLGGVGRCFCWSAGIHSADYRFLWEYRYATSSRSIAALIVSVVFTTTRNAILALLFGTGLGALGGFIGKIYASGPAVPPSVQPSAQPAQPEPPQAPPPSSP